MIIEDMQALLDFFEEHVPDRESNRLVFRHCDNRAMWPHAHDLFTITHEKNLEAADENKKELQSQYCFEEVVAQTLYNLTSSPEPEPFDAEAPYYVIKNALSLAKALDIPDHEVLDIIFRDESF